MPKASRGAQAQKGRRIGDLYRLLIESVTDYAIFVLDPEGRIASWNPGAARLKGYSEQEIIGRHFSIFYSDDVTAGKPAKQLEIATRKQAEQANRAKMDFLGVMSHELRTPLNAIAGYAELLKIGLHGPLTRVHGDADKFRQIVLNLLSNAIKFTDAGGTIAVSCGGDGETVKVVVSDTGKGIPQERLDAIFDRFVQVDKNLTRENEGAGLGLAISRDLARLMHGDITVSSELGKGSTFTLQLPDANAA